MPGHESGHTASGVPLGLDWQVYLSHFVGEAGGWAPLANTFLDRASGVVEVPLDAQSVEKGLRRLAKRGNQSGGQYGRWMLRFFGVPTDVGNWARWLAQYHSRFADLPTSLRLDQLRLWDRPPVSESAVAGWINVGLASVFHRLSALDDCRKRLAVAERQGDRAGAAAVMEISLLRARMATDEGRRDESRRLFDSVDKLLGDSEVTREDELCYRARLVGQRAYHLTKPAAGEQANLEGALELFQQLEDDPALPFVCYRRSAGLAYCAWKLGDPKEGARLARLAADHAGDGGFVRFRIMALNMLSRMVDAEQARSVNQRAERLARQLEDEDLLRRVRHRARRLDIDEA